MNYFYYCFNANKILLMIFIVVLTQINIIINDFNYCFNAKNIKKKKNFDNEEKKL